MNRNEGKTETGQDLLKVGDQNDNEWQSSRLGRNEGTNPGTVFDEGRRPMGMRF